MGETRDKPHLKTWLKGNGQNTNDIEKGHTLAAGAHLCVCCVGMCVYDSSRKSYNQTPRGAALVPWPQPFGKTTQTTTTTTRKTDSHSEHTLGNYYGTMQHKNKHTLNSTRRNCYFLTRGAREGARARWRARTHTADAHTRHTTLTP